MKWKSKSQCPHLCNGDDSSYLTEFFWSSLDVGHVDICCIIYLLAGCSCFFLDGSIVLSEVITGKRVL